VKAGPALSAFRQLRSLFVLFVFLAPLDIKAQQEILTNETIVNMTKAHLGDKVIVDMIKSSPGQFVVTSGALIALKQKGVSDTVIAAVRAKMANAEEASPSVPRAGRSSNPQPRPNTCDNRWHVLDTKDEITGKSHFEADRCSPAVSNGRRGKFEITATCSSVDLAFKVAYFYAPDAKLGYKMTNGNVVMRLSIDGRAGSAPSTTSDFTNVATLRFQRKMTEEEEKDLGLSLLVGLMSLTSPAAPAEVYQANLVKVEMPLNNGDLPIFEIRPQDPDFREFASRCQAQEAAGIEAEKPHPITADQFTAQLEESLTRRGLKLGSGPTEYGAGFKRLIDIVHICASISPTEFANLIDKFGNLHLVGGKYGVCSLNDWAIQADPRFSIDIDIERFWQREKKRWDGAKFRIKVYLKPDLLMSADIEGTEAGAAGTPSDPEPQTLPSAGPIIKPKYQVGQLACVGTTLGEMNRSEFNLVIARAPAKIVEVEPGDILFKLDGLGDRLFFFRSGVISESCASAGSLSTSTVAPVMSGSPVTDRGAGDAVLTISGQFTRPLSWGHYWLLRDDLATALNKGGIRVPSGASAASMIRSICQKNEAACNKITQALDADGAAKVYADNSGTGNFAGVPPGGYYLMVSALYNNRLMILSQAITLKRGPNSFVLSDSRQQR